MRRLMHGMGDVVANASIFDKINPLKPSAPDVPVVDQAAFAAIGNSLVNMTAQGQEAVLAMVASSEGGQIEYRRNLLMAAGGALVVGGIIGGIIGHMLGDKRGSSRARGAARRYYTTPGYGHHAPRKR